MRKAFHLAVFVSIFLIVLLALTQHVNLATANPSPFPYGGEVSPDGSTKPPTIAILTTNVSGNNFSLDLKATVGESTTAYSRYISEVYYYVDWNQDRTYVYRFHDPEKNIWDIKERTEVSYKLNVTSMPPEGIRTITLYAVEKGGYIRNDHVYGFSINGSYSVNFTMDVMPPNISVLSVESRTYNTPDILLNFTISETASKISYVLNGVENVTINGNTTLLGLAVGAHNLTIYAWDSAGNIGASETVTFNISNPEPFPNAVVVAVSVAVALVVAAGLLLYHKRHKHNSVKKP